MVRWGGNPHSTSDGFVSGSQLLRLCGRRFQTAIRQLQTRRLDASALPLLAHLRKPGIIELSVFYQGNGYQTGVHGRLALSGDTYLNLKLPHTWFRQVYLPGWSLLNGWMVVDVVARGRDNRPSRVVVLDVDTSDRYVPFCLRFASVTWHGRRAQVLVDTHLGERQLHRLELLALRGIDDVSV